MRLTKAFPPSRSEQEHESNSIDPFNECLPDIVRHWFPCGVGKGGAYGLYGRSCREMGRHVAE